MSLVTMYSRLYKQSSIQEQELIKRTVVLQQQVACNIRLTDALGTNKAGYTTAIAAIQQQLVAVCIMCSLVSGLVQWFLTCD